MARLEPCNTASCTTTPLPHLTLHRRNPPAVPFASAFQWTSRLHRYLSFWETRCRSASRLRAGTHPPFPYFWDRSSDCPLLHRGSPPKAPGDRERHSDSRERNLPRGMPRGYRTGATRTARPVTTSLSPTDLSRIPYPGVKIPPG